MIVGDLKVGTVFRSWDGEVYRLAEKSGSRAILDPGHKEVAHGCEVLEVLDESKPVEPSPKAEGKGEKETPVSKGTLESLKTLRSTKAKIVKQEEPKKSGNGRMFLFDLPVTGVLRWMGKDGFTALEAAEVLKVLKVNPMPNHGTIRVQTVDGRTGKYGFGDPAVLTADQQATLRKAKKALPASEEKTVVAKKSNAGKRKKK